MNRRRNARHAADFALRRYERARVAKRRQPTDPAILAEYDAAHAAWTEAERVLYLLTHGERP